MRLPFVSRRKYDESLNHAAGQRSDAWAAGRRQADESRAQRAKETQDVIDRIAHEYYLASAIYRLGRPATPAHAIGIMDGLRRAMAAVVGRSITTVGFGMEHGIPQGPDGKGWMAVVDNPDTNPLHVVLHDGVREPVADRLDHLHMEALRKDNHPLYAIVTRERAEAKANADANA